MFFLLHAYPTFEYSPADPSLLGENIGAGAEVRLRLRRPDRDWDFFPYEEVLDTMLHELCHNEYGPHNAHFYNLWDEIRKVIILMLWYLFIYIYIYIYAYSYWY
jgi:hypothetical protein